jgi:hypothetical protein
LAPVAEHKNVLIEDKESGVKDRIRPPFEPFQLQQLNGHWQTDPRGYVAPADHVRSTPLNRPGYMNSCSDKFSDLCHLATATMTTIGFAPDLSVNLFFCFTSPQLDAACFSF